MLVHGLNNNRSSYSAAIRKFCLRFQFRSAGGYEELRKFFNNNLPTNRTLQRWLRVIDVSPGIIETALDAIAEKAKSYKLEGKQLLLTLISDEMSIRKHIEYNEHQSSFKGFPSIVNSKQSNKKLPIAKDALVFMAVGPDFRITVCYHIMCGLDATDRAILTKEVIRSIDNTGARVISITGDGLHANITVAKLLGANFEENKPYFASPGRPNQKVHVIFDPSHMIKLLRKYLAEQNLCHGDDKFDWQLLKKLVDKQDSDNFSLGNKLTMNHINYNSAKMNVGLAVQTISNSTADALEQLREDGYEDFDGCEKMVKFLRLSNNVYDVMNYGEGKKTDDQYKIPLCELNIEKVRTLFSEFENFVSGVTMDVKRSKSIKREAAKKQIGFFGFLVNIRSTLNLYEDFIQNGPLDMFYTFQYSQDHVETYFSLVRASLGSNINPTEQQFQSAFRKLLFFTPHISGDRKTNCNTEFPDALLEVSSASKNNLNSIDILLSRSQEIQIPYDYNDLINIELGPYDQHVSALSASEIELEIFRDIKKRSSIACQYCLNVFHENLKYNDSLIERKQNRSQQIDQPCLSTMHIVVASNQICKILESAKYVDLGSMIKTIFSNLDIHALYESSDFDSHIQQNLFTKNASIGHKEKFVMNLVQKYMNMKSKQISHRITIEEQKEEKNKRKSRRNAIFAGKSRVTK